MDVKADVSVDRLGGVHGEPGDVSDFLEFCESIGVHLHAATTPQSIQEHPLENGEERRGSMLLPPHF